MSRPRLDEKEKRIVQVNIRLTTDENNRIAKLATESGLSPANWIRAKIFTGKFPAVKMSVLEIDMYRELRKIGVNLNQAAHKLNQGDYPPDLRIILQHLSALMTKIFKAIIHDR